MPSRFWRQETVSNLVVGGDQRNPTATALADGSYIIAWEDISTYVRIQRFLADGTKVGPEFNLADPSGKPIQNPEITALENGGFIVTYDRVFTAGTDIDVHARLYSSPTDTVGTQIFIDNDTGLERDAATANLVDGAFVTVWRDNDLNSGDIEFQRFAANGSQLGSTVTVNTTTAGDQQFADVATSELTDRYLVVWNSGGTEIRGRVFNSNGSAVNGQNDFLIGSIAGFANTPTVTALANGNYVVTWHTSDAGNFNIRAQIVSSTGSLVGGPIFVSTAAGTELFSDIAATPNGGFAIAYFDLIGPPASGASDLYVKTYSSTGAVTNEAFQVNTSPISFPNTGSTPDIYRRQVWNIASLEDGRLVVSWESDGAGGDGSGFGIRTQIIDPRNGTVTGNAGNNQLYGNDGQEFIVGNAGNDRLFGLENNDTLAGGPGNDYLDGGTGNDIVYGGFDSDTIVYAPGDTIVEYANQGTDTVLTAVTFTLAANFENLTLIGGANVNGTGNSANNVISGNGAVNTLRGLGGNDTLLGASGGDLLVGDDGNDVLAGGPGNDVMNGGLGNDTYYFSTGDSMSDSGGIDRVISDVTHTLGAAFENLQLSGTANISGTGNALANSITGNTGSNILSGGGGNDTLSGSTGSDILIGGAGRDVMFGGGNADRFDFNLITESVVGANRDVISGFVRAEGDKVDLATIDANSAVAGNQAFTFIGGAAFTGAGQVRFAGGILYGNTGGSLAADFEIQITGVPSMLSTDFTL